MNERAAGAKHRQPGFWIKHIKLSIKSDQRYTIKGRLVRISCEIISKYINKSRFVTTSKIDKDGKNKMYQ